MPALIFIADCLHKDGVFGPPQQPQCDGLTKINSCHAGDVDQTQLASGNELKTERAGCRFDELRTPVMQKVLHGCMKGKDVATGCDLWADGWTVEGDGALDVGGGQHLHLPGVGDIYMHLCATIPMLCQHTIPAQHLPT